MLTAFLDAITNLSPKPFLLGGYILFCIAFTVRVFQSWHRTLRPSQKTKNNRAKVHRYRCSSDFYEGLYELRAIGRCPWSLSLGHRSRGRA